MLYGFHLWTERGQPLYCEKSNATHLDEADKEVLRKFEKYGVEVQSHRGQSFVPHQVRKC